MYQMKHTLTMLKEFDKVLALVCHVRESGAEMRHEPNRMGPGQGPGARSISHYSKVCVDMDRLSGFPV